MALGTQQRGSGVPIGNELLRRLQRLENLIGINGLAAQASAQQFIPPAPVTVTEAIGITQITSSIGTLDIFPANGEGPIVNIEYPPQPSAELYSNSSSMIPSGEWTNIPGMSGVNAQGTIGYGGNTVTTQVEGLYIVCAQVQLSVSDDSIGMQAGVFSDIYNTQRILGSTGIVTAPISGSPASLISKVISCAAGEILSLQVLQFSATESSWPLYYIANGVTNWMTVTRLEP